MPTSNQFVKLRSAGNEQSSRVQDNVDATLGPVVAALNKTPIMGTAPVLTPLTLASAFASQGGEFGVPSYYTDSLWRVWCLGVVVSAAGVAANATVMTLPMGVRPATTQRVIVKGNGAAVNILSIANTGIVTVLAAIGAGGTVDLGFSFLVNS